ncbi:MAG: hypothetical protein ACI9EF_003883 [Pseudohongiellaceae bacterium]|jgi:hypothetical protein
MNSFQTSEAKSRTTLIGGGFSDALATGLVRSARSQSAPQGIRAPEVKPRPRSAESGRWDSPSYRTNPPPGMKGEEPECTGRLARKNLSKPAVARDSTRRHRRDGDL